MAVCSGEGAPGSALATCAGGATAGEAAGFVLFRGARRGFDAADATGGGGNFTGGASTICGFPSGGGVAMSTGCEIAGSGGTTGLCLHPLTPSTKAQANPATFIVELISRILVPYCIKRAPQRLGALRPAPSFSYLLPLLPQPAGEA
jgi:hypothetical protein